MTDSRAIGVFDSGLGGLTVLRELMLHFPRESFIYLGDTARLPYGSKSPTTIRKYSEQNIAYLIKQDVKAIVIACNSASSQFLEEREFASRPLYNVIEPGSLVAASSTTTGHIGILGTRATVTSEAYPHAIQKIRSDITVHQQPCPLFVPLAEEGWEADDPLTSLIVFRYLQPLLQKNIDTVVMGCTHYPMLKNSIQKVFGASVRLVDSGKAIADLIEKDVAAERLHRKTETPVQELHLLTTDANPHFQLQAQKFLDPFEITEFELINV